MTAPGRRALLIAALALAFTVTLPVNSAFAWGCIAVSEEGSYGYSYSFDNEDYARERALNECASKTTEESVCEITECDENS